MSINISQTSIDRNVANTKKWAKDTQEGKEYCNGAKDALKQWDYNKDGKTSANEMYQDISKTYASVFRGNDEFSKRAQEIASQQAEIYAKYAGDDGVLDEFEYTAALNSSENNALLDEYWMLKDSMEAMQGENDIKGLSHLDENNDKKTSIIEIFKDKLDIFSKIFQGDAETEQKATKIALDQSFILSKYAGDDGVLSQEEYQQALRSEGYGKTMSEYLDLKSQLHSYLA